ncbi:MAG: hypothetical protein LBO71_00540, partial [Prevotellaceae bacterium]|nr:hypothetical protein [Prevotellaceae bacterium]
MKNFIPKMLQHLASTLSLPLLLLCGAVQVQAAAATVAGDLITVSDEANGEVWYYIEVPYPSQHSTGATINDHAGRGFTMLTVKNSAAIEFNPLLPNSMRSQQQWKVVANGASTYSFVNKNGSYVGLGSALGAGGADGHSVVEATLENAATFTISQANTYFVKALNSSNAALGAYPNSTSARFQGNPT